MSEPKILPIEEQLSQLFGSYKAEWMRDRVFELFTEPAYFPELETPRPCLLVGGRGTGKTTVLRTLSYQGRFAREGETANIGDWNYYGLYYRVNTNRVTAFDGPEISEDRWARVFGHYFNLISCDLVIRFLEWFYRNLPDAEQLSAIACKTISTSLKLPVSSDFSSLAENIALGLANFESYINNIADADKSIDLSLQGAPIDCLMASLQDLNCFQGKFFFFLIDEYENFLDYQQQVVNTLIKHAGETHSYKIGVRELGWRYRATLNENEQLVSPADYVRIDIADRLHGDRFVQFARAVCRERIARLVIPEVNILQLEELFPELSEEEEAAILDGGNGALTTGIMNLSKEADENDLSRIQGLSNLEKYLIYFWATGHGLELREACKDYLKNPELWKSRLHNYKHAMLFTIRRGLPGIQKYYAGWHVLVRLASGNIRYLLELVDQILLRHLRDGGRLDEQVSPQTQTLAAQHVGRKNLSELEGLTVHGAQLTKLLLGLGRIFQTMAADAAGHMAEVNHFHMADPTKNHDPQTNEKVTELLTAGVMHLALIRFSGSKLSDESDTRDYDYMVHPIFSAFFSFSYRKKRKIILTEEHLLGLVDEPRRTIRQVLTNSKRQPDETLPEQLQLFQSFYGITS